MRINQMESGTMRARGSRSAFLIPAILLALALLAAPGAPAAWAVAPVNANWRGLAIKGYDPVAYFEEGKPVQGKAEHAFSWMGASWHFASARNRDLFRADPGRYAPQYGGYCAWAVSQGYTADIDPAAWRIVNGKLYLNYDKAIQEKWAKDIPGHIAKADTNWPDILKKK
jgi:YHS domain-containing protein